MTAVRSGISIGGMAMLLSAVLAAQTQQRPTFRSGVDLVQIDVVVVDANGQPVSGLTKDDFEVFDRASPRSIAAFKEIAHERPPANTFPPALKRDVADNTTSRSDRLIVIVLDDLHLRDKTDEVKRMAVRVVNELGPGVSLALITTSGNFGVEPTEDRALILSEIERYIDKFDPEGRYVHPRVAGALRLPTMKPPPGIDIRGDPGDLARFFAGMTQYRTLQEVAAKIGGDDGRRKAFVWISSGNTGATTLPRLRSTTVSEDWHLSAQARLLEALRKANIAAYPIHTGHSGDLRPAILQKVADGSGGFVLTEKNFENDVGRLIADLDHYYLLGFYPEATKAGEYRPIEVRVKRPGVTLRYRRGYHAGPPAMRSRNDKPLARLAEGIFPSGNLPLRLAVTHLTRMTSHDTLVAITLEVQSERARLAETDGLLRDVLNYSVWAVDLHKKKVVRSIARNVGFILRDESATASDTVRYQVQTSLMLPPGRYQLRASAMSSKLSQGGSVYLETIVPDSTKTGLTLSGIILGHAAASSTIPIVGNRLAPGVLPVDPTLDRTFTREETLHVFCTATTRAPAGGEVLVDLIDQSNGVVKTVEKQRLVASRESRVEVSLRPGELAPGAYRLRATATDAEGRVEREVGFVVR